MTLFTDVGHSRRNFPTGIEIPPRIKMLRALTLLSPKISESRFVHVHVPQICDTYRAFSDQHPSYQPSSTPTPNTCTPTCPTPFTPTTTDTIVTTVTAIGPLEDASPSQVPLARPAAPGSDDGIRGSIGANISGRHCCVAVEV